MSNMNEIELIALAHSKARETLRQVVILINSEIEAVKRKRVTRLRAAVFNAKETGDALLALVHESPNLFQKPKSLNLHGLKFGWKKEKGRISFEDPEKVIKLIRKHLPELADTLIITTEKPSKDAMNGLQVDQLKKIGVKVTADSDVAFLGNSDSDVDKLVNALLGAGEDSSTAQ